MSGCVASGRSHVSTNSSGVESPALCPSLANQAPPPAGPAAARQVPRPTPESGICRAGMAWQVGNQRAGLEIDRGLRCRCAASCMPPRGCAPPRPAPPRPARVFCSIAPNPGSAASWRRGRQRPAAAPGAPPGARRRGAEAVLVPVFLCSPTDIGGLVRHPRPRVGLIPLGS